MTSADLLYSTGTSAQCYVAGWMRGIWGRVDTCICMAEFLYCIPETITILLIGYTPYKIKSLKKEFNLLIIKSYFSYSLKKKVFVLKILANVKTT